MINCNDMLVLENKFGRKLYTQRFLKDRMIWQYLHRDKSKDKFNNIELDECREDNFLLKVKIIHG